jgi:hypothetical protein
VEFFSGGEFSCEMIEILMKFGIFFGDFWWIFRCLEWQGPNHNYFLKLRVLLQFSKGHKDRGAIYNKLRGFCAKFTRFSYLGIISQW